MTDRATVAVLGAGAMGAPMASRLAQASFPIRVWNRTRRRAEPLAQQGAVVADTPAEAAEGAQVLITMLLDADATEHAVFGPDGAAAVLGAGGAGPGPVWAQMGTVGVAGAGRLARLAAERSLAYADAPVLGSRAPAAAGKLAILASAAPALREPLEPVFAVLGGRTLWVGEDGADAAGSRLKLAVNSWVLALTAATAEALALADGLGLDPKLFLAAIEGTPTDSPYAHLKGGQMIAGDYDPAFTVAAAAKDAGLIARAASEAGLRLPVAAAVREAFAAAVESGHADLDMAALHLLTHPE